jgi:hypothetical protein
MVQNSQPVALVRRPALYGRPLCVLVRGHLQERRTDADTAERVKLGTEMWQTVIEETHVTATVGLSPAARGLRTLEKDFASRFMPRRDDDVK